MIRRRVHLPPERIGQTRAELTDQARHYLRDVLRLAPGAAVELFDGRGGSWEATIEPGFAALALGARREALAGGPSISLLFALAKGEKGDLVVQKATELGAARHQDDPGKAFVVHQQHARQRPIRDTRGISHESWVQHECHRIPLENTITKE